MKKQFYSAPAADQIEVRMEGGCLFYTSEIPKSAANTSVEAADYHEDVEW